LLPEDGGGKQAARLLETSGSYRNTTEHHNSEDLDLNLHHRENMKSRFQGILTKL